MPKPRKTLESVYPAKKKGEKTKFVHLYKVYIS